MSFLFLSSSAPPVHGWEDLFPSPGGVGVWEAEEHSAGKRPHSSNDLSSGQGLKISGEAWLEECCSTFML